MTKPRVSWLIIPLGGIALAAAAFAWGRSSAALASERDAAVASEEGQRVVALEREVQRLRAAKRKASLDSREAEASSTASAALDSERARRDDDQNGLALAAAAREELDPDEAALVAREARIKYFDELSRRIDTEAVDGAWRHRTEEPIKQLLSRHLGPKITVSEATCATSFCRVKLSHPESPRLPSEKMFEFDLSRASLEVTEVQFDIRDEGTTTLYFMRGQAPVEGQAK